MNNPECYRCKSEGWVINTLGVYIVCPVCHDSRIVRILKESIFNLILKLFKLSSDYLNRINWASEATIRFARLYNVELEGKIELRQELPFENYEQVFENGNEVLKNKIAYKILSEYVMGYSQGPELVKTAVKELVTKDKVESLYALAESTHGSSLLGKDNTESFYRELNDNLKN